MTGTETNRSLHELKGLRWSELNSEKMLKRNTGSCNNCSLHLWSQVSLLPGNRTFKNRSWSKQLFRPTQLYDTNWIGVNRLNSVNYHLSITKHCWWLNVTIAWCCHHRASLYRDDAFRIMTGVWFLSSLSSVSLWFPSLWSVDLKVTHEAPIQSQPWSFRVTFVLFHLWTGWRFEAYFFNNPNLICSSPELCPWPVWSSLVQTVLHNGAV